MDQRRPTLTDVARCAGVSYATADRVVNDRGRVADKSIRRVQDAVAQLGYVRNVAAANLSQQRIYRFVAFVPDGSNAFFTAIRDILTTAQDRLRPEGVLVTVRDVPAFDAPALARALAEVGDVDGVVLVGVTDPRVSRAAADLRARGIAVLTMVSDLKTGDRDGYVGIDNGVAGQTAGRLVTLAHRGRTGRVLPVVGAMSATDHADRLAGFAATVQAQAGLAMCDPIEGRDRDGIVAAEVARLLARDDSITAIYNTGAGNAGLIMVLSDLPAARLRPVVIVHELLPDTRLALADGLIDVVIDQRPETEVALALDILRRAADRRPLIPVPAITPAIYVKDNLPPAPAAGPTGETLL